MCVSLMVVVVVVVVVMIVGGGCVFGDVSVGSYVMVVLNHFKLSWHRMTPMYWPIVPPSPHPSGT